MTEFRVGIFTLVKRLVGHSSLSQAIIYTVGHIIIAMTCNRLITGAELELAAVDAVIEPIINGCWFYLLDKLYTGAMNDKRNNL